MNKMCQNDKKNRLVGLDIGIENVSQPFYDVLLLLRHSLLIWDPFIQLQLAPRQTPFGRVVIEP